MPRMDAATLVTMSRFPAVGVTTVVSPEAVRSTAALRMTYPARLDVERRALEAPPPPSHAVERPLEFDFPAVRRNDDEADGGKPVQFAVVLDRDGRIQRGRKLAIRPEWL